MDASELQLRRTDAQARLARLRADQGATVLDGGKFDGSAIADVQAELEALDAAEAEADRRGAAESKDRRRGAYLAALDDFRGARDARIAAVAKAEAAAEALGAALKEALDAADRQYQASVKLQAIVLPDGYSAHHPSGAMGLAARLHDYLCTTLYRHLQVRTLGGLQLGWNGAGGRPAWADAERALGDDLAYHERRTPAE
jgi:hypothetical protein